MRSLPALMTVLFLALSSSCRQAPPPGASGDLIYELQNCANCHGEDRRGTKRGPALFGLGSYWERTSMAEFFADPKRLSNQDARLGAMAKAYPAEMSTYDNLTLSQRLVLADYLLSPP